MIGEKAMQDLFNVTAPWNPDNDEEGVYTTTVKAGNEDEAKRLCAEEMADSLTFSSSAERQEWIDDIVNSGFIDAYPTSEELKNGLRALYGEELFPDGVHLDIDLHALGKLLSENRDRLLIKPAPTMRAGG